MKNLFKVVKALACDSQILTRFASKCKQLKPKFTLIYFSIIKRAKKMSGLNPVDVVEEDAADLLFPKGL